MSFDPLSVEKDKAVDAAFDAGKKRRELEATLAQERARSAALEAELAQASKRDDESCAQDEQLRATVAALQQRCAEKDEAIACAVVALKQLQINDLEPVDEASIRVALIECNKASAERP